MTKKDVINAIKLMPNEATGNLYDFISNYGYSLDKGDLVDIIKELSYAIYSYLHEQGNIDAPYFNENILLCNMENEWSDELAELAKEESENC